MGSRNRHRLARERWRTFVGPNYVADDHAVAQGAVARYGEIFDLPHSAQVLNGLFYCKAHARDVCHDCALHDLNLRNLMTGFKPPPDGRWEFPSQIMGRVHEGLSVREASLVALRWLAMQRVYYTSFTGRLPPLSRHNNLEFVELPEKKAADHVKNSVDRVYELLSRDLEILKGIAGTQRYLFGSQSPILMADYQTFTGAKVLFEQEMVDCIARRWNIDPANVNPALPTETHLHFVDEARVDGVGVEKAMVGLKAESSLLNAFGFLLELQTLHSFWRIQELTVEEFAEHVSDFDAAADGNAVVSDKAKDVLTQFLAECFWAVQHSQFRFDRLRQMQHEIYQLQDFPFYPYSLLALEANLDIHEIILKLAKAHLHNLPTVISLLEDFGQASKRFPEQMRFMDSSLMAALDEFVARFSALQVMIHAAQMLIPDSEIKVAFTRYKFDCESRDLTARFDEAVAFTDTYNNISSLRDPGLIGDVPILYKLIVKENKFRRAHAEKFLRSMSPSSHRSAEITEELFESFRDTYNGMYPSILLHWGEDERSLLSSAAAKRVQPHRLQGKKKKKGGKKKHHVSTSAQKAAAALDDTSRSQLSHVPDSACMNPEFFWVEEYGDIEESSDCFVAQNDEDSRAQECRSTDSAVSSPVQSPDGEVSSANRVLPAQPNFDAISRSPEARPIDPALPSHLSSFHHKASPMDRSLPAHLQSAAADPSEAKPDPSADLQSCGDAASPLELPQFARLRIHGDPDGAQNSQKMGPWKLQIVEKSKVEGLSPQDPNCETVAVRHSLSKLKESDLLTRDILWGKEKGTLKWKNLVKLLTCLGCSIKSLLGSRRKVIDPINGRCAVLHQPHPHDECRPDQRQTCHLVVENLLGIKYEQIVIPSERLTRDVASKTLQA